MQDGIKRVMTRDGENAIDLVYADMEQLRGLGSHCAALSAHKSNTTGDVVMLAEVPAEVLEKYCNERGIAWMEFMRSNDLQTDFINSEYARPFRVWGRDKKLKF